MTEPSPATLAVDAYVRECARIAGSGAGTDEQSYYPPLNRLLGTLGALATPRMTTIAHPAAREGDFPDVACWDELASVLVLPVEVKGAETTAEELLALDQARRYARSFGAGHVLLSNLREFVWAELDERGTPRERDRVTLLAEADALNHGQQCVETGSPELLLEMLKTAWALRPAMSDARVVARALGYQAGRMAAALAQSERPEALLRPLTDSLKEGLGMDLEEDFLVGTVVQTLVYGLFAAWLDSAEPQTFKWQEAAHGLEMPVIANLMHNVSNPAIVRQANLDHHLRATARVLNWVDREAFEEHFGSTAIEYFYEPFLAAFDPALRNKLGVWYTPREVAEYQVRRVDHHLRADFGFEAGLADERAVVLDPACGTGTYLAAVLRHIYAFHRANGEPEETAARRTLRAAHERVVGFEILPAAFVVAYLHLHRALARELGAVGVEERRLRVFLCNALTGWGEGTGAPALPLPGLEDELREALEVKAEEPVLVILGNPPYEGYSAADNPEEKELARPWTEPLWPTWRVHKHRLGDLYVRFWRIALRKIAELTGRGVVSFISNRKWLSGRSFPAMREDLLGRFQRLVIDDLHGDVRGQTAAGEGSVFTTATATGIRVGVAIATAVRTGAPEPGEIAEVRARDVGGSGAEKREQLARLWGERLDAGLAPRSVSRAARWTLTAAEEEDAPGLDEYLDFRRSGVQPVRDQAVTDIDRAALEARMRDYFNPALDWEELIGRHPAFAVERERYEPPRVRERLLGAGDFDPARVIPFLFRPFDRRWLYWELRFKLLNEARAELDPIHRLPGQRYIVQAEIPRRRDGGRPVITTAVPAYACVDPDGRAFPRLTATPRNESQLAIDPDSERGEQTNVQAPWLAAARAAGLDGDDIAVGDAIFHALIAVLYSPAWSAAVPEDIGEFPGVPLPDSREALEHAEALGRRLAEIADPWATVHGVTTGLIEPGLREIAVAHVRSDLDVTIGSASRGFGGEWRPEHGGHVRWGSGGEWRGVPEPLWRCTVGGFPVLAKWLSYRTGRALSADELEEFTAICRRLAAIVALQPDCDALYREALVNRLDPVGTAAASSVTRRSGAAAVRSRSTP